MQLKLSRAFCNFLYEAVDLDNTPELPRAAQASTLEELFEKAQEAFDALLRLRTEVSAERKLQEELLLTMAYLRRKAYELERKLEIQDDRHPLERLLEAETQKQRPWPAPGRRGRRQVKP